MSKRKKIPNSVRFEVFKRDSFKCQYCGREAPSVVLELEHIEPHSLGGTDDILNLVTSCWECNSGKGARRLSDDAAIQKQRNQLDELQERRDQLEMMLRWREGNKNIKNQEVEAFCQLFESLVPGHSLNDLGKRDAKKLIREHGIARSLEALERSTEAFLKFSRNGKATQDSLDKVLKSVWIFVQPPEIQVLYRFRAIVRKRTGHERAYVDSVAIAKLRAARAHGSSDETLRAIALDCPDFETWCADMDHLLEIEPE